jgi:acyl-CoA thioesterase FadM
VTVVPDGTPDKPTVDVTITVALSDGEVVTTHRTRCVWVSKNGLTPAQVPGHVEEMVQRTVDKLRPNYCKETP